MMARKHGRWIAALVGLALALGCGGAPGEAPEPGTGRAAAAAIDTPQGGTTAWARRLGGRGNELILGAAAAPDGGIVLLTAIGGGAGPDTPQLPAGTPELLGLVRLRADGSTAWSREFPMRDADLWHASVAVTGLGNVFLFVRAPCTSEEACPDFGGGPVQAASPDPRYTPAALVKLGPAGAFVWQRLHWAEIVLAPVTVDANGSAAFAAQGSVWGGPGAVRIVKHRWDGVQLWDVQAPDLDGDGTGWPAALAFDPAGNLAFGDGVAFGSLDPAGHLRWTARLSPTPVNGRVVSLGTTALGTVVAFVQHGAGAVSWAGTQGAPVVQRDFALFLAVAEPNGAPRFGRVIAPDDRPPVGAAVDPAGRVAILTRGFTPCTDRLERWNLAGQRLWSRAAATCGATGMTEWRGVTADPVSHHVRAFGALWGTVGFGAGATATSRGGADDLLLDVMP